MTQAISSPIAFFCYNRPEHTRRTLEALKANYGASQSRLIVFSDSPRDEKSAEGVRQVREYLSHLDGFASIEIIEREENYGCAKNIILGITQVAREFGRVIIVEDDILTSPYFLTYMNEALELYKDDDKAGTVNGYLDPMWACPGEEMPQSFFRWGVGVWGWGTWQRSWCSYEYDAWKLLQRIKAAGREDEFNFGLKHKPNSKTLEDQGMGYVGTWDYQLVASMFLHGRLSLVPGRTLTNNIGFDETGVHCGRLDYDKVNLKLADEYEPLRKIPVEVDEHIGSNYIQAFKKANPHRSIPYRIARKIWHIMRGRGRRIRKT